MDSVPYKSGSISLLLAFRGDVWVMEDGPASPSRRMWEEADPEATRELYKRTPVTRWDEVPWDDYDIVFSNDPIVPDKIIKAHPGVLWCYRLAEHTASTYEKVSGSYDLACDHTMASPKTVEQLPQAVSMPFTISGELMRNLVHPTNEPAVWLPARSVRPHGSTQVEKPPETLAGLPVKHPGIWNFRQTYRAILDGLVEPPLQHFQNMGSCRYLLNVRPGGAIGQPIIEAAALGLIVISAPEAYDVVAHPYLRVSSVAKGVRMIATLEDNPAGRQEISLYQDRMLREHFWNVPLIGLRKALDIKRKRL